jgi:Protein of unknown function (DUF1616)
MEIVKKHRPSSLASLKRVLKEENVNINDEKILVLVQQLQSEGIITLSHKPPDSFWEYLVDIWNAWWFYLTIIIAVSELVLVISNAQTGAALVLRILLGLGMLGIIPGSLTVMTVFPGGDVNFLERIALSIFLSVMISIAVGVLLGLGPFFQATNNIIILAAYVVLADVAASYRSYNFLRSPS